MKPTSHAMSKTVASILIQVQPKPHLKKYIATNFFNLAACKNDTELSKEFWKVKRRNSVPPIKWKILRKCSHFNRL